MNPAYKYQMDISRLKAGLRPYLIEAMNRASDELLKCMKINVHKVTDVGRTMKGAPGDPEWRNEVDRDLRKLYANYADNYLEVGVGADYKDASAELVRAMVIAYGAGSAAGNEPIHAGPAGREVWNDSLTGKKDSKAAQEYDLPDAFNQQGNDFVNEAVKETEERFNWILADAMKNIPMHVYQDALVRK